MPTNYKLFSISNTLKNHSELELFLFENYSLLSSKNSRRYSKKYTETSVSVLMRLYDNDNENEAKNEK